MLRLRFCPAGWNLQRRLHPGLSYPAMGNLAVSRHLSPYLTSSILPPDYPRVRQAYGRKPNIVPASHEPGYLSSSP